MTSSDSLREQLWELVYDLLPEQEAQQLRERVTSDPAVARAYAEVKLETELVAKAARYERPPIRLEAPSLTPKSSVAAAPVDRLSRWRRLANQLLALAAMLLVCLASYLYFKPDSPVRQSAIAAQQQRLANQFTRTVITGPTRWQPAAAQPFVVTTTAVDGRPQSADVQYRLYDSQGDLRLEREESTGSDGTLQILLPTSLVTPLARLEVQTKGGKEVDVLGTWLEQAPPEYLTYLTVDKPLYRPGETVLYRSLTVSRFSFSADQEVFVDYQILGPGDVLVANSQSSGLTQRGVGNGAFTLQPEIAGGQYTLVARSPQELFPEQRRSFFVREFRTPRLKKELELDRDSYGPGDEVIADVAVQRAEGGPAAGSSLRVLATVDQQVVHESSATLTDNGTYQVQFRLPDEIHQGAATLAVIVDDGGTQETVAKTIPINLGKVEVDFYPEGGDLVAGITSRVYFFARDPLGEPVHIEGSLIDGSGKTVAVVKTSHEGRGVFRFTPEADEQYVLRITKPDGIKDPLDLPRIHSDHFLVIDSGSSIFERDEPLSVTIRSRRKDVPLLVAAFCRGVLVGQQKLLEESWDVQNAQQVMLPVSPQTSGVVRVTVYDYSTSPPRPLAERLVYRQASQQLQVEFAGKKKRYVPGEPVELSVQVVNENGEPTEAVLGISAVDQALLSLADEKTPQMTTEFWLTGHIDDAEELEDANFYLSDDPEAAEALDLLLGTNGWRRFADEPVQPDVASGQEAAAAQAEVVDQQDKVEAPLVWDNFEEVQDEYAAALAGAFARRRDSLEAWTNGLIIGAVTLLVILLLMAAARVSGDRKLWSAALLATTGCLMVALLWSGWDIPHHGSIAQLAYQDHGVRLQATPPEASEQPGMGMGMFGGAWEDERRAETDAYFLRRADRQPALDFEDGALRGLGDRRWFWQEGARQLARGQVMFEQGFGEQLELGPAAGGPLDEFPGRDMDAGFAKAFRYRANSFPVRQYAHQHRKSEDDTRSDFTETLYWNPLLLADASGRATVQFDLSDSVTSFAVHADAHGSSRIGSGQTMVVSRIPFSLEPKLPAEVTAGDRIELPLAINNDTTQPLTVTLELAHNELLRLQGETLRQLELQQSQRERQYYELDVVGQQGEATLLISGQAGKLQDRVQRSIRVVPSGFPVNQSYAGRLQGQQELTLALPGQWVDGSLEVVLQAFPSSLADLQKGVDGLLNEPTGCFEQASSSNYPNVLALHYMEQHDVADPAFRQRARGLLGKGYTKLTGYESPTRGYEWFGADPGHEALTAYGLMEFQDMAQVWDVDQQMIQRTARWLLARRDGQGGFQRNPKALDSFGAAPPETTNAYIVWALSEAGQEDIQQELEHVVKLARSSKDPYFVALAARAASKAQRESDAVALCDRLVSLAHEDGHLETTDSTITRSGGLSMQVETTALAALAWLSSPQHAAHARRAIDWIINNRQGSGHFGSTQSTVLALKAIVEHVQQNQQSVKAGTLVLKSDGQELGRVEFPAGQVQPISMSGISGSLKPDDNDLTISLTGDNQMPYVLDVSYRTSQPVSDERCPVRLATHLSSDDVDAGQRVGLTVELSNVSGKGQPMTVAVVGLPAGLEARAAHLEELQKAGKFDYYEQRGRELVFYWRSLAPDLQAEKKISFELDLIAEIPGRYRGPASRAYLYYTAEQKHWVAPLKVVIKR